MNQDWQTTRNQFMRTIGGDPPGAQLEDHLIHAYTNNPDTVERAMTKIALAHKAGKIRSPWGALKAEVDKASDASRNPTHDTGTARANAIQRAEQWLKTAGIHYDRETEILDELFGERGILQHHDTPELRARILQQWHPEIGEQLEAEANAAAEKRKAQPPIDMRPTVKTVDELKAIAAAKAADTTDLMRAQR